MLALKCNLEIISSSGKTESRMEAGSYNVNFNTVSISENADGAAEFSSDDEHILIMKFCAENTKLLADYNVYLVKK